MKLSEWPTRNGCGRISVVDQLPDDVRDQLVDARRNGTHSVSAMVEWLKAEGYEHLNVTRDALYNWFQTRGIRHAES